MNSFLDLFDPTPDLDEDVAMCEFPSQLPPEPQLGNIEYKLKLVNPSKQRFEHLVTQLKWRLREGQGEAIYEIGVEDNGLLTGLSEDEMEASLQTLWQMARKLDASSNILRERTITGDNGEVRRVAEVLVRKVPDDQHSIDVRIAVLGSADVGKSTVLGVLTQGELDNGKGRARLNMFRHLHEIQSGRTSSISHEVLGFDSQGNVVNYSETATAEEICELSSKLVTFIDLAGHQKYIRTTVFGLTGYSPHYVLLVVSATAGIVPMSKEHLSLTLDLEVPVLVIVTKIDLAPTALLTNTLETLESVLKSPGINKIPIRILNEDDTITASSSLKLGNIVPIFCISSVTGMGLDLLTKFLHVLPPTIGIKERERLEQELCEFQIDETFQVPDVGTVVGGLLTKGVLLEGSELLLGPSDDGCFSPVRIHSVRRNKAPCRMVRATQSASLGLNPQNFIRRGMVLLPSLSTPIACQYFQACVKVVFHTTTIYTGFQTTVHIGNVRQTAIMCAIMSANGMHTNDCTSVIFKFIKRPEYLRKGSRLIFREGCTKGTGKVTQIFPFNSPWNA